MKTKQKITAIVPAAGVGSRMQHSAPKQYIELAGKTILEHTLSKLAELDFIHTIKVAISDDDGYFDAIPQIDSRIERVSGGTERADSVLNALLSLADNPPDWVLVHDAARPLVCLSDITRLVDDCLAANEGGILASKVKDTIKRGRTHSEQTVPRDDLWQALTPQFFPYQALVDALSNALENGVTITDEASAIEWAKQPVKLVAGRSDNIKITTPEDLDLAAFLLQKQQNERTP
ncbi:2-C-methyl-D-erythritol 4-phosphate cytidylyltransferase [Pseudoalteromonas lipolytica]|uniref:2-C-methyl-D-erythritol 4-phosphate cytidylyltransferase n=2 Tax=Pseudoalteromonas lipolytica TaxID=570156 RepID=A0ABY1GEZ2_9GAMM|nr:2-C-methyl-D-erythritol 4-phosphate cytidylyltransferase [Pseudoalteromonas lipolytica]MBE0351903.1 2-C-methyl-D-erythritol 4-phosphate cytidylyltransferase [Pseudoalteromonas lipolytica LMEB 39]SFT59930.1 2-C-methyl-D-erythritol 4-phosphate cytidylyltransferase [Pseudoalteromonas lipolytica]